MDLLVHLSRRIRGSPILILGTYRPSDVDVGRHGQPHPLRKAVQDMHRYDVCQDMPLDRLEQDEFTALITAEFPDNDFPGSFLDSLFRRSGGTALFITEMLRFVRDQGLVERRNGTWHLRQPVESIRLPRSVESIVAMRIDRLGEDLRRPLQNASVEGERFLSTSLAKVSNVDELLLEERLGVAEHVHRFIRTEGELEIGWRLATVYEFAHVLFQKTLYDGLQPKQRVLLHRRVGLALRGWAGRAGPRSVLFVGADYTDIEHFDPVIARPVTDTAQAEPAFVYEGWYPARMATVNRLKLSTGILERLVVTLAQFASPSTERLYNSLTYEVYYSTDEDETAPTIWLVEAGRVRGRARFRVDVTDNSEIERVVVAYNLRDGRWRSFDLAYNPESDRWAGELALAAGETVGYFVQAVDKAGNVTTSNNKGLFFEPVTYELYLPLVVKIR